MKNSSTYHENPAKGGILLIDKPVGISSFRLVSMLRRRLNIKKIGHSGTLDPNASGVMVMLIGRAFTRLSDKLLNHDKQYEATLFLGKETDTFDLEGEIVSENSHLPTEDEISFALQEFQGEVQQTPPMFSAKKINGKKLYELAREGKTIERKPSTVRMEISQTSYDYPFLKLNIDCSKGTYVRSLAHDLGQSLGCGAYLHGLIRTRSGPFCLKDAICSEQIANPDFPIEDTIAAHTRLAFEQLELYNNPAISEEIRESM